MPIEIYDGDVLLDTVMVDQTQNSGWWNILGTYDFTGSARVVVVSVTDSCSTCADAAGFRLNASEPAPDSEPEPDSTPDPIPDSIPAPDPDPGTNSLSGGGTSGGCFIGSLR